MKKNLILTLIVILSFMAIMLIGNIIVIGDKIARLFPYADYVFYGIILLLIVFYVVVPFFRVFFAPSIPALNNSELIGLSDEELFKFGILLAENNKYINESNKKKTKQARKAHYLELRDYFERHNGRKDNTINKISEEIDVRIKLLNKHIKEEALSAFIITGLSQNGKFDMISLLAINFRLIKKIVMSSGFRPSHRQLIWIYFNVLISSILTDIDDEVLADLDLSTITDRIKVPSIIVKSTIDGAISALLTLRIGYITKYYIVNGREKFNKKEARMYGFQNARKNITTITGEGSKKIGQRMGNLMLSIFK